MTVVGMFDISKYTNKTCSSTEVILFLERKQHILEHHPEVAKYLNCIPNILKNPDCIFWEINRESTIWLVKKFDKNIKLTVKLNFSQNKNLKNSIIQMQIMRESEVDRNIRNGNIIKLFDKNNPV